MPLFCFASVGAQILLLLALVWLQHSAAPANLGLLSFVKICERWRPTNICSEQTNGTTLTVLTFLKDLRSKKHFDLLMRCGAKGGNKEGTEEQQVDHLLHHKNEKGREGQLPS